MTMRTLLFVCALVSAVTARGATGRAEEPTGLKTTKRDYPSSQVARPLVLPPGMFQPSVGMGITNMSSGTGETLSVAMDFGIVRRLQAGVLGDFPINPNASFGTVLGNLQVGLASALSLRFDLGLQRISTAIERRSFSHNALIFGVGVPLKLKLSAMFALVSGSSTARGFASHPLLVGAAQVSSYGGSVALSNDIFAMAFYGFSDPGGPIEVGVLTLPLGLLVQPHDRISFTARIGYRMAFAHAGHITPVAHFIPLAFDVVVNPVRVLDIGFTAALWGYVATDTRSSSAVGYADLRQFDIWVAARF